MSILICSICFRVVRQVMATSGSPEFNVCAMCVRVIQDALGSVPLEGEHFIAIEQAISCGSDDLGGEWGGDGALAPNPRIGPPSLRGGAERVSYMCVYLVHTHGYILEAGFPYFTRVWI